MDLDINIFVCFDFGDILGAARFSPSPPEFVGFIVCPHVFEVLAPLWQDDQWFGIVSDTGGNTGDAVSAALELSSLLPCIHLQLQICSRDIRFLKGEPQIVCLAAGADRGLPEHCVFVCENDWERYHAMSAGIWGCLHPLLVEGMLRNKWLRYVQISIPPERPMPNLEGADWQRLHALDIVPLHEAGEPMTPLLYALVPQTAATALSDLQLRVTSPGAVDAPLFTDLYLLRDDKVSCTGLPFRRRGRCG